jgi:hypothetical protein
LISSAARVSLHEPLCDASRGVTISVASSDLARKAALSACRAISVSATLRPGT